MIRFIKHVPLAVSGLALGLAALGNLLLPLGAEVRYVCGALSFVLLLFFVLRIIFDFNQVFNELKAPVPLGVLPTSTMAVMLICIYVRPFVGDFAGYIWFAAVIIHVCIMILFFKRFVIGFKPDNVYPSWFVAFVGIVTASVTAPVMGFQFLGQIAFYFGFISYFIVLILNLYKMKKRIPVTEPLRLTNAIFTAPMCLCIVGYFSSFDRQNEYLVYLMLCFAMVSYIFVIYKMLTELLRIKFYPTYAAFTFPFVISATAFRLGNEFLMQRGIGFFVPAAYISMWIAVVIVMYVLVRYVLYFRSLLNNSDVG